MSGPVPLERITEGLRARAAELARHLLPHGHREGPEWREASTRRGGLGDSLAVRIEGPSAGVWLHGSAGAAGDALDLVAYLATGGDKGQAIAWSRRWLGLDGGDPAALGRTRAAIAAPVADTGAEEDAAARRNAAFRLWLEAQESLAGSPVERYLAGRAIDLKRLAFPPGALRFHPRLWNRESQRHWPAMVAAIHDAASGQFLGCHRTWLAVRPDGRVTKAPLDAPKMTLGPSRGGIITICKGYRVDAETGEITKNPPLSRARPGQRVNETEGLEDALSVAVADPTERVACGVALGKMAAIRWPPSVSETVLWQQNDDKPAALDAFRRLVEARRAAGLTVRLARPPDGYKDANEYLQALAAEANGVRAG
jgi:hypothetical protein